MSTHATRRWLQCVAHITVEPSLICESRIMDKYLLTILAVSLVMTATGIFQNKKIFLILLVAMSVLVGWYIQVIRVDFYNELAWEKFTQGTRASEPSDGASASFALLFGWIPSLVLSAVIIGVRKLYKFFFDAPQNKQIQSDAAEPRSWCER